ncbi:phage tail protein [Weissella muntiaci]|uniref:Phage tail protein n=1 Tax=Weissella muntiaci TaxID=2508881 RepID=A0A6C2CC98_9LACO|nr:phage tail protein [Weissella muntiaci]TYC50755.1 phage tail protein [Weissella muntiaci]
MAQVGLKRVFLALINKADQTILKGDDGLSEDGLFEVTTAMLGTKTANITNISTNGTPVYGNNSKVDQTQAKGEPSVALDFNNLPFEPKQKALGRVSDGKGGYLQEDRPQVALLIESQTLDRKNSIYYGLANGEMQENAVNVQTDTNNEVRADDAITFTSFGVAKWNDEAMKVYYSGADKFDKPAMMADVFGGYAEATTTPSGSGN